MKYWFLFFVAIASLCGGDDLWEKYKAETIAVLPQIPGWCTPVKAAKIMDFIYAVRPKVCVEIGSFGGSTTYPIARSLKFTKCGSLSAIDAWDTAVATLGLQADDPNAIWWKSLDMKAIHSQFRNLINQHKLSYWCRPIRKVAADALWLFPDGSVDFIYIDGNHTAEQSLQDVVMYFPKVKKGGYIWLNDSHFESKNKTVAFLMKRCEWIKTYSVGIESILFKKKGSNE